MKIITKSLLVGSMTVLGSVAGMPAAYALCQGVAETNNCLAVPANAFPSCSGTNGDDILVCLGGPCVISGFGGNDILVGAGASDRICGDGGSDVTRGNGGNDGLSGGTGPDFMPGDAGNDIALGGPNNDAIDGGVGDDTSVGGGGFNVCFDSETNVDCDVEL